MYADDGSETPAFDARWSLRVMEKLDAIHDDVRRLFLIASVGDRKIMTTLTQLDAAIDADTSENTTLLGAVTAINNDVTALLAKVAAGQAVDFTAELTKIQANTSATAGAVATLAAADASANAAPAVAPVTPVAPAPVTPPGIEPVATAPVTPAPVTPAPEPEPEPIIPAASEPSASSLSSESSSSASASPTSASVFGKTENQ